MCLHGWKVHRDKGDYNLAAKRVPNGVASGEMSSNGTWTDHILLSEHLPKVLKLLIFKVEICGGVRKGAV